MRLLKLECGDYLNLDIVRRFEPRDGVPLAQSRHITLVYAFQDSDLSDLEDRVSGVDAEKLLAMLEHEADRVVTPESKVIAITA